MPMKYYLIFFAFFYSFIPISSSSYNKSCTHGYSEIPVQARFEQLNKLLNLEYQFEASPDKIKAFRVSVNESINFTPSIYFYGEKPNGYKVAPNLDDRYGIGRGNFDTASQILRNSKPEFVEIYIGASFESSESQELREWPDTFKLKETINMLELESEDRNLLLKILENRRNGGNKNSRIRAYKQLNSFIQGKPSIRKLMLHFVGDYRPCMNETIHLLKGLSVDTLIIRETQYDGDIEMYGKIKLKLPEFIFDEIMSSVSVLCIDSKSPLVLPKKLDTSRFANLKSFVLAAYQIENELAILPLQKIEDLKIIGLQQVLDINQFSKLKFLKNIEVYYSYLPKKLLLSSSFRNLKSISLENNSGLVCVSDNTFCLPSLTEFKYAVRFKDRNFIKLKKHLLKNVKKKNDCFSYWRNDVIEDYTWSFTLIKIN